MLKQGSSEWLDRRSRCAATASEYGNAVGVGYVSRKKYMKRKLGLIDKEPPNWRMLEGQKREDWVCELYYRFMGGTVNLYVDGFRADPDDHRLGGSVDRIVEDKLTGERWVLECKTCPGGDMRTEIPTSHLLQMMGLCHCYGYEKAHYICHSQGQGILLAEVTFAPGFWETTVYPWLKQFADWWAVRHVPGPMKNGEAAEREALIRANCFVNQIPIVASKRQQLIGQ